MRTHLTIIALLLALTAIIYTQTRTHDFVNFDDASYIYNNPHLHDGLTLQTLQWAFTTDYFANWIPLTWISYLLDATLFDLNPRALHLENALGHALNGILLYLTTLLYTKRRPLSFLIALLFIIHPMHVESVAWLSERKDILSTLFALLTLIAYHPYATRQSKPAYAAALLLYACSLMAKPMLMTLPVLLILLDIHPLQRWSDPAKRKSILLDKIPFALLAIADLIATLWAQSGAQAIQTTTTFPLAERIPNAIHAYAVYLGKFFIPHPMLPYYPHPENTLPLWKPALAAILLIALTTAVWRTRKKHPAILLGWAAFIITLLPVIGIIQVGGQAMADRYTYIPYIGLTIALAAALAPLIKKDPLTRNALLSLATLWCIALTALAHQQTAHWKNSITLYTHTLQHTPENLVALTNLGEAYLTKKEYEPALKTIQTALAILPDSTHNLRNLGILYRETQQLPESETTLKNALAINPSDPDTLNQLAMTLYDSGRPTEALPLLRQALEISPDHPDIHNNLGNTYLTLNDIPNALQHLYIATTTTPNRPQTWSNLGAAHILSNDFESALKPLQTSLKLDPDNPVTLTNYAVTLYNLGNKQEALKSTQKALKIDPNYLQAQAFLTHLNTQP